MQVCNFICIFAQMKLKTIHLEQTDSTNRWLREHMGEADADITVVTADYQTAGRGQGSNTWESEQGKNLLFSMLVRPNYVPVQRQYLLSMTHALALYDTLSSYTDGISIKWPNDIYWHDRKICGTLIELGINSDGINSCIFGTGIDVNQRLFRSDAPNPVSLWQILGRETDLKEVLDKVISCMQTRMALLINGRFEEISSNYHEHLYRREGLHSYRDDDGEFQARLIRVADDGRLWLCDSQGKERSYMFKEVAFVI